MEIDRNKQGILISQRKYTLDLLKETCKLGCKPCDTPVELSNKLSKDVGEAVDRERYQRLVGLLIYLSHIRPDIAFVVSLVSRYMYSPSQGHLEAIYKILRYLKGEP